MPKGSPKETQKERPEKAHTTIPRVVKEVEENHMVANMEEKPNMEGSTEAKPNMAIMAATTEETIDPPMQ